MALFPSKNSPSRSLAGTADELDSGIMFMVFTINQAKN